MGVIHFITVSDGTKLALHDLGGSGPPLLLLHCNGISGQAYLPLAQGLQTGFRCWALDIRGHGDSAHEALHPVEGVTLGAAGATRALPEALWPQLDLLVDDALAAAAWLRRRSDGAPVRVFGHSLGGLLAAAAEIRRPGTFAAMYLFEAVIYDIQPTHQHVGNTMSGMALRRRTRFPDRAAALASWSGKPPFVFFDPQALRLYAEHGLRSFPGGGVELVCDAPRVEAWIYVLIEPLISDTFARIHTVSCPVTIACGGGGLPADLDAIAPQTVARLPQGRLKRFEELHHFGPLEKPQMVAADMLAAFQAAPAAGAVAGDSVRGSQQPRSKL